MKTGDTIVAAASGGAAAARTIVRLSGPGVYAALAECLVSQPPPARRRWAGAAVMRLAASGGGHELPVLLLTAVAPASFTGEDAAEILLPGNPHLVERVIDGLCGVEGVRRAEAGEFSFRAYVNGRMTLAQAEGVAGVIAAASAAEAEACRAVMRGERGARYAAWAEELATVLALVEAGIDFADEEGVVAIGAAELASRLGALERAMGDELGARGGAAGADWRPRAVLVGVPNAGKSTLFNALLGRRRSVESAVAGTTRDLIAETMPGEGVLGALGLEVALVDGPGVEAGRAAEVAARGVADAGVVVWCDPTGRFDDTDVGQLLEGGDTGGRAARLRVRTKADVPRGGGEEATGVLAVCALDGRGVEAVRGAIVEACWGAGVRERGVRGGGLMARHRAALARCVAEVRAAGAGGGPAAEVVAAHLRTALDALGELTGRIGPDAVIGRIFSTFCIGK